jgi:hypothetical protein
MVKILNDEIFSEAFILIAERCADTYGTPLPKRVVQLGSSDKGWFVALNPTPAELDGIPPFSAEVSWNGWPAGLLCARSGLLAAGEVANEAALVEWLKSGNG